MKHLVHFLLLWLWIGFVGGAGVLLGIATPLEARMKAAEWSQADVNRLLFGLAAAWVVSSGVLARLAFRRIEAAGRLAWAHVAGAAAFAATFAVFLQAGAGLFGAWRGGTEAVGERFVFGPYPDADEMRRLAREERVTAVVTLLSSVVPFEAVLLEQEKAAAAEAGMRLVEAPMLPWVSSNDESLEAIRALARSNEGRYYVHCYLGRHRVEMARYAILEAQGVSAKRPAVELPGELERGPVIRLDDRVALGPLPTKDEWFEYVVRSGTRRVVSMLDPENPDDVRWIDEERRHTGAAGLALEVIPVRTEADAARVVEAIRAAETRVYVHGFRTDRRVEWVRAALAR